MRGARGARGGRGGDAEGCGALSNFRPKICEKASCNRPVKHPHHRYCNRGKCFKTVKQSEQEDEENGDAGVNVANFSKVRSKQKQKKRKKRAQQAAKDAKKQTVRTHMKVSWLRFVRSSLQLRGASQ